MLSSLDSPVQPSALPSPPTSPTSPRTATTRIRIKPSRRPGSAGNAPPAPGSQGHPERTRSMPPSLSRIVTADLDTPGPECKTIAPGNARASVVAAMRRQSSITYYTPSSPAPCSQRPQSNRTLSSGVDGRDREPVVANGKDNASKRSSLVLSSHPPSARESMSSLDATGTRDREPLTLVEKHADLLHFIAQKERKCLELRDQLAAHEKELAELKRKWERIVHGGHDPLPNPTLTASIGGATLDGLKEGVRMIAAGFSDLGGVIHEFEPGENDSKPKPLAPRKVNDSYAHTKRTGSEHLSMSSMSSTQDNAYTSNHVLVDVKETMTVATAPSLSRTGSVNRRIHKRSSCVIAKEATASSASFSSPAQCPKSAILDVGMSLILAPSPTLVPTVVSAPATPAPKSPVMGSALSVPVTARPVSTWMDSMGKKLSELQNGQTFSKSQKRASLLLAGVSSTVSSALSPGPTATTPAPVPVSVSALTTTTRATKPRTATSSTSAKSSLTTRRPPPSIQSHDSRPYPIYQSMTDWLDDDEEQTVHPGGLLIPDSKVQPQRTKDGMDRRGEESAYVSFDDDWNW